MIPHHDGSELYVPNPAPVLGETVSVSVRVPARVRASRVHLRWLSDGEPVFTSAVVDRTDRWGDVWWRAEMPVRNPVTPYRFLIRTSPGVRWLTGLGLTHYDVPDNTDFRLVTHPAPPGWAGDAVVYQIFPDRFARSGAAIDRERPDWAIPASWDTPPRTGPDATRTLYGGDLDGIVRRLDHVAALGADTLYLTPFFPSRSSHRYDASSFDRVDPLLGGDAALTRLSQAVHERGMRILGDLTTNHTGLAHPWFTGQKDFYYSTPDGGFESWLGLGELPKLNWGSAELRRRFVEIIQRWLAELDGWRIDVANMTGRRGADDWTYEVASLLRGAVHEARPDGLLIAEHAHDATGDLDRNGWHGTMNYAGFTRPVWGWLRADELPFDDFLGVPGEVPARDAAATVATMTAFQAQMSWRSWTASWSILGSHDTARIRTVVGDADRQEVAAGLLMTLPGVPMIFAGDEIGLTGDNNDTARQPMPWDRTESWDRATLDRYRRLIALRKRHPALRRGGLRWIAGSADSLLFLRECAEQSILVMARRAGGEPLRITDLPAGSRWENLYGGAKPLTTEPDGATAIDGYGPTFQVWQADIDI